VFERALKGNRRIVYLPVPAEHIHTLQPTLDEAYRRLGRRVPVSRGHTPRKSRRKRPPRTG